MPTPPREPLYGSVPMPGRWTDRGACRGWPTEWWYPGGELYPNRTAKEQKADAIAARRICRELCPVSTECLIHALRHREPGIWAGLDATERQKMRGRSRVA